MTESESVALPFGDSPSALQLLKKVEAEASAMENVREQAFYYKDTVKVAMEKLRKPADELEMVVDKDIWPIPTYGELMFEAPASLTALTVSASIFVYLTTAGIICLPAISIIVSASILIVFA